MIDEHLRQLVEKQAITETIYQYAQAVDRRDSSLMLQIFDPDGWLRLGTFESSVADLVKYWASEDSSSRLLSHHQLTNVLIVLDNADRATAITYVSAVVRSRRPEGVVDEIVKGRYLDRFVKQERWRFLEKTLVHDWGHVGPAGAGELPGEIGTSALSGTRGDADPGASFDGPEWEVR